MIIGGQSFVSSAPAFSNDAKKLLVCTGNTISVFSTSTGILITELEGHTDRVTSVVVVPVSGPVSKFMSFCWTSSLDGSICYWDFSAAELIKKVKATHPIISMVIPRIGCHLNDCSEKESKLYAFVSAEDTSKPIDQLKALRGEVHLYNLTESRRVGGLLCQTRKPQIMHVSKSGDFIGIVNKRQVNIWQIPDTKIQVDQVKRIRLHHTKNLTTLAFHPTERVVAGGDVTGRILIWRAFGGKKFSKNLLVMDEEERPGVRGDDDAEACTTWHWHASEVKFLLFSSDGVYLYSGGKEGVIVVWQLDTGKKKFKPRLGSPLISFIDSPDPVLSCISCADNQIHLLKMPTMEIIKSISGIKLPFSFPDLHEGSYEEFSFHNDSGLIALCADDYCIQFFSLFDNMQVSQVQICERNFQPVDDVMVFVALTTLSPDGSMMSTVDVRLPEEGLGAAVTLKFWSGSRIGEYSLSTVIYEPHRDAQISAIAFRPGHSMAVSSSLGGDFKVWINFSSICQEGQMHEKSGWRCQSVGSYKNMPMTATAFSTDGSVLAVAAETVFTLWDPDKNVLIAVIGNTITTICKLSFVAQSEYLLSISRGLKPQLALWNLSKMSMQWSYQILVEAISTTKDGSQFAILASDNASSEARKRARKREDGIILLFDVQSPIPLATWRVRKAKGGGIAFLPSDLSLEPSENGTDYLLVYINGDHDYVIFDPLGSGEIQGTRNNHPSQVSREESGHIGYTSVYGELPQFDSKKECVPDVPFMPMERPWETIFAGSSHILPPLTKLCSTFLESLLERRPTAKEP
ncbi:Guanine nucleotide-binding protein subunit beta-like protein B [Platanthera guangdongensis]|uniref:Guanine nucleotide-binding protein subunit beta-like protein B n=1 Tax=Platanthera guangdongensis TaxID=2320717 RepID=A0ABR2MEH1_9ASPA